MEWFYIGAGILFVALLWSALLFNSLIRLRNRAREAFSGVDVQLKRRHDLVPNLVRTVSGYAKHEQGTLEEIVRLRSQAINAGALPERGRTESSLSESLSRLFLLVENYPDLKADQNFRQLQTQLVEVEDHLQYARRYYNGAVRDYNNRVEQFPGNLLASAFNFPPIDFFQLESQQEGKGPTVAIGENV